MTGPRRPVRRAERGRNKDAGRAASLPPAAPLTVAGHGPQRGGSRLLSTPPPYSPLTRGRSRERRVRGPFPRGKAQPFVLPLLSVTPPYVPHPYREAQVLLADGPVRRLSASTAAATLGRPRPAMAGGVAETLGGGEGPTLRALSGGLGSRRPAGASAPLSRFPMPRRPLPRAPRFAGGRPPSARRRRDSTDRPL